METIPTPRHSELKRLTTGTAEDVTLPCETCGVDVTRSIPPAGTTFGEIARAHTYCDSCVAEGEATRARIDEESRLERVREIGSTTMKNLGLPPLFADASLELCRAGGTPEHAMLAAERWAAGEIRGLVLTGPVGVGKSTLAAAAVKAKILADGYSARWATAPALFAGLAGAFDSAPRADALHILQGRGTLVLDDIDKGRPTEYGAEMTYLAVDQRLTHLAPLLVTANSDLDGLAERWPETYSDAIVSRLIGHCEIVAIEGIDRRIPTGVGTGPES